MKKYNKCLKCGHDSHFIEKNKYYDIFRCMGCGVKFQETGLGPELVPGEFEEDVIYFGCYWSAGVKLPVCILIKGRFNNFGPAVLVNAVGCDFEIPPDEPYYQLKIYKEGEAEYLKIGKIKVWAHNASSTS